MLRSCKVFRALAVAAVAAVSVVLIHCNGGPTGPAGPKLTGAMTGFTILVKSNGGQPTRRDSVVVSIDSTSLNAMTDSAGQWSIPDVMTGTYNLTFTRNGYSSNKLVQVQFTGGGTKDVGTVYLCQVPGFSVGSLSLLSSVRTDSTTAHLEVRLTDSTVSGPYMPYRVFLFLGTDSSVSSDPAHYQSEISSTMSFQNGIDSTTIKLTPSTFASNGFAAGDRVFIAAYAANAGTNNSTYLDPVTGRTVYTNVNPARSNVVTVIVGSDTTGPAGTGSITGSVALIKANGLQPAERESVAVSIDGTQFSAITDSIGAWSIPNLGPGTYNFSFSRAGYDTARAVQVGFTGTGSKSLGTTNLCQAPSFNVSNLWHWVSADTNRIRLGIKLDTTLSDSNAPYRVFLFFGTDSFVSSNPSHYAAVSTNNVMIFQNGVDSTSIILTAQTLVNFGFVEGNAVYIAAYAANAGSANSAYTDPATGRAVYVNINPVGSNVVKVVVP
jgi:Carboxypeptidase regulatory-like domain